MPLVPNFEESQLLGSPEVLTLTDISTGSDAAITARRVYLRQASGAYLTPDGVTTDYVPWPLADVSIDIDALSQGDALDVTVQWVNASGVALYTKTRLCLFLQHFKNFLYDLTQGQTGNPGLVNDNDYWEQKGRLFTEIDSALNAVEMANDIYGAKACLNRAQTIVNNAEYHFF